MTKTFYYRSAGRFERLSLASEAIDNASCLAIKSALSQSQPTTANIKAFRNLPSPLSGALACIFSVRDGTTSEKMLRLSLLLLALGAVAPLCAAEKPTLLEAPLSYEEARTLFHDKADILRSDNARIARAQHEQESARSLGGPRVELAFKQIYGTKNISLDMGDAMGNVGAAIGQGFAQLPAAMRQALGPALAGAQSRLSNLTVDIKTKLDGPRLSLDALWPIYTGGLIDAQKAVLAEKVTETLAERDARLSTLDAELVAKYWGVQLAQSIEALRASALADQEDELKRAKRFEQKGLISKLERLAVEVARDTAERELKKARTNLDIAERELANTLRADTVPALSSPLFILKGDLGTLSAWQDRAMANSPVLRRITSLRAQADQGVRAATADFKPKVFAFGSRNLIKHYLSVVEPDWIAGVGVTFTLWSDRDRFAKVAAAQDLVDSADAARSEAVNQIRTAIETAFLRANQYRDEYLLSASNVALASENLRLREKAFSEGLSTANDVDIARTQMIAAELSRRVAAYQFIVSWAMLHAAAGVMDDFPNTLSRPDTVAVY